MLSDIEKFKYLKGTPFGEATSEIAELAITSYNYQMAVDILKRDLETWKKTLKFITNS